MVSFRDIFVIFISLVSISVVSNIFTISRVEISWGVGIVRESSQPGSKTINTNPFRQLWVVMSATMWPVYVIVTTKPPGFGTHLYCYYDITTRSQRSSFTTSWTSSNRKGFCLVTKINSWFIHLLSFPVIFLNIRVAARWITNKMLRIVSTRGVLPETESVLMRVTLHWVQPCITWVTTYITLHRAAKQRDPGVINMANFLVNYWLTRTNNCLIIIPARLPTPVAGRHFSSEIGKISFQFDCWLLDGLYGGLYEPFSHCRTDSVSNSFIACIK